MSELRMALKKWYIALPFYALCVTLSLSCAVGTALALTLFFPALPAVAAGLLPALLFALPPLALRFSTVSASKAGKAVRRHLHICSSLFLTSYLYFLLCVFLAEVCGIGAMLTGLLAPAEKSIRIIALCALGLFCFIHLTGFLGAERIPVRRVFCRLAEKAGKENVFLREETLTAAPQLRAVFLSDLHFGFFTGRRFFSRVFRKIEELKPDLLLLGGDQFDFSMDDLSPRKRDFLRERFSSLAASLPLGIYACEGNHDRIAAEGDPRVDAFLESCGIRLLRDEAVSLSINGFRLRLVGRRDGCENEDGNRKSPDALLAPLPMDAPLLVLDHRPKQIPALGAAGADLVLCGHVHNGQSFPGNLLYRLLSRYSYGKAVSERPKGGRVLSYTTSGCGRWALPLRFLTSNEIVLLSVFLA